MSRTSCFSFCVHINRIDQPHFQPLLDVVGRHFIRTRKYMTLSIPIKVKSISYSKFPSKISTTECLMFSHTIDLCFMIPAMFYCMDSWSNTYFLLGRRLWYLYTSFSKFKIPVGVFLRKKMSMKVIHAAIWLNKLVEYEWHFLALILLSFMFLPLKSDHS